MLSIATEVNKSAWQVCTIYTNCSKLSSSRDNKRDVYNKRIYLKKNVKLYKILYKKVSPIRSAFSQRVSCISQIKHRARERNGNTADWYSLVHYILGFLLDLANRDCSRVATNRSGAPFLLLHFPSLRTFIYEKTS